MEDSPNEMDSPKEFNCIFCKETFECKEELQIHFRKHGDPKFNQSSKSKVRPGNETPGEKSNEEVEMISCDVCPELFPTISKAITHKHKVHPDHDAKHFCPWCGKLFTMKHLYNKHISTNHENPDPVESKDYPCDCCDVTFHVASAMLYHNKFFHRQDTDLPSIGQSKKLKMADQNSITIYYCPFCGQEYNNKVNLHKHMTDDHSDENQSPDDVLRCPLCDAIFYHLDAYEHHLIFHSVEDMYSEKNEMIESVTEFSLESVPPIMERVENLEPEPKEAEGGAMGLDDLLQMAMGNTIDEENPRKSKKHKKHKKSKKAAITLDEFLNMNKDVFGEGIDFQGIEEVPSQVVAKKLKVRKKPTPKSSSKMSPKEIEKLRKQGIVIKMKPGSSMKKQTPTKVKQIPKNITKTNTQINSNAANSPNDVLSKLINQSNSQIKIVRKPAQTTNETGSLDKEKPSSPENIEVECDLIPRDTSSETETEEKPDNNIEKLNEIKLINSDKESKDINRIKLLENIDCKKVTNTSLHANKKIQSQDGDPAIEENNDYADDKNEDIDDNQLVHDNTLKTLKNVKQNITVNPVSSSPKTVIKKIQSPRDEHTKESTEIKHKEQTEMKEASNENESKEKPINALKHLSHLLTIKSIPQQPKTVNYPSSINHRDSSDGEMSPGNPQMNSDDEDDLGDSHKISNNTLPAITKKIDTSKPPQTSVKSLNAFKNISSNVTIKPMIKSVMPADSQISHSSDEEDHDESSIQNNLANKQCTLRPVAIRPRNVVKSPASSPKLTGTPSSIQNVSVKETSMTHTEDRNKCPSNVALLKNLTNVTAKPIGSPQNTQINKCIMPVNKNISQNRNDGNINQDIEIFNIDDSDSDNEDNPPPSKMGKPKVNAAQSNNSSKPVDALKNLSKHLTIKSTPQKLLPVKTIKPDPDQDEFTDFPEGDSETESDYYTEKNKVHINKTNTVLQNTLKNLSKHITIKSRNSSPSSVNTSHGHHNEDSNERFDMDDSDSDNENPGQVKITEVDDQQFLEKSDEFDEDFNDNMVVQSPPESGSDNDEYSQQKPDEDLDDIESKIQASTLMKADSKHEESFRNLGKGITIKSLSEKKTQSHSENASMTKVPTSLPGNLSKELSIKPFRQNKGPPENNVSTQPVKMNQQAIIKNNNTTGKQVAKYTNQSTSQKMCATNQTNTVNKEVTVKTFQTQTVIQEITTTVTKTIKTVNQTMKQEVQSSSQSCTQNVMRKVQGMRPPVQQPGKNYQGVVVRHATPTAGAQLRGGKTTVRATRPAVKVSNQLVPVRAGAPMNMRPQTPRMPTIRGTAPSTSTNSSKPVKISPKILNSGMNKRQAAPETAGPFSCFKKPKESLMSMSEMSGFQGRDDDSMISFASSSQMNKSNVMNMARTMKGNTVVSSTQMKSEVSSCSQQLSKLNNVTGLRIVKTSQAKQASHVEERQEASPAKRMTQEAIEKLQKQGLLVKKPRLETNEEDYSEDEDDGGGHFPPYDDDDDFDAE